MKKAYTPLIGKVTENDPLVRLTLSMKTSQMGELLAWMAFYKDATGDAIERPHAVTELLKFAIGQDKSFNAWKKDNPTLVAQAVANASKQEANGDA
jgi:hypothetical protein